MDIVRRRFMLVLTSWKLRVNKFRLCSDRVRRVQIVVILHLCGFRLMLSNLLTIDPVLNIDTEGGNPCVPHYRGVRKIGICRTMSRVGN